MEQSRCRFAIGGPSAFVTAPLCSRNRENAAKIADVLREGEEVRPPFTQPLQS
jgi:hypothetical protein